MLYTYRCGVLLHTGVAWSVCQSIGLSRSQTLPKTAEPIEMPFGTWTRVDPRKHVLDRGARWRNLANTAKLSMCGGDAAFLSNYSDHLECSSHLSVQ